MGKNVIHLVVLFTAVASTTLFSQEKKSYSEDGILQEYNERIVYSTFKASDAAPGIPVLAKDTKGIIVIGNKAEPLVRFAAEEVKKYIKISTGMDLVIKKDVELATEDYQNNLIVLSHREDNSLTKKLSLDLKKSAPGDEGAVIRAWKSPFSKKANVLVIAGNSSKGVLNGVYAFLDRGIHIKWFPPRIHRNYMEYFTNNSIYDVGYYRVRDENRFQIETYVERRESILWPEQEVVERPVAKDLGMIYDKMQFRKSVVDWSVKNRLNTIVVYVDINFPLQVDESNRLKEVVHYAHRFGMQVHFFTFTHICSKESRQQFPEIQVTLKKSYQDKDEGTYVIDNPKTLEESTKLMVKLVQEYDIDGIGWHPASERIDRTVEEGKPKYYWETVYISEYDKAIRKVKPDAKLFFVLGWEYMNPPSELRKYLPEDIVAWIVPSRTWTREYINDYFANFPQIWFWMYPWYSTEGVFPDYKIATMQKSVKEGAANHILGIVPEMYTFRNHEMNLMSLVEFYWHPEIETDQFIKEFNDQYYYHDSRGHMGYTSYVEGDYWGSYKLFTTAYQACNNPMVRDRLKDMAIASLRLIGDAAADAETMYKTCQEAETIFAEHYLSSEETDLFYIILQQTTEKWRKKVMEKGG